MTDIASTASETSALTPITAAVNAKILRLYDNTRISDWRRCGRYFYYRHVRDWTPDRKSPALIFGSSWHEGMDVIWAGHLTQGKKEVEALIDKASNAFVETWVKNGMQHPDEMSSDEAEFLGARTPMVATEMFWNYWDERQHIFKDPSFKLIDIERPFAVPLDPNDDSLWYVGRLDKIFGFRGYVNVGEHKCLGVGTPVLKFDGSIVPVESIRVGDMLMGPNSAPRKITSICTGIQELFQVTPTKGNPYIVNKAHILSLKMTSSRQSQRCGTEKYKGGQTVNVAVTDYLKAPSNFRANAKGWRASVDFESAALHPHLSPYMLGVWLGDGNCANQGITAIEPEIIQEIQDYAIYRSLAIRTTGKGNSQTHFLSIGKDKFRSNPLLDALRSFNLIDNKHIPLVYKANDRNTRLEVLAGIIDTDGNAQHNGYRITQKNKTLAEDICYLARSLGLAAYMPKHEGTCTNNGAVGEYYYIYVSGNCSIIPVRVPRKRVDARKKKKDVLVTGIDVIPVGPGRYYGFELEGDDHLFLLGDFTVTHNTTTSYKKDGPFRADFVDSFTPNSQIDGYLYAGHSMFKDKMQGVWVDASLVHKTVHDGFMFIPVERQLPQLDAWLWETHYYIDQIEGNLSVLEERKNAGVNYLAAFPKNTGSCSNFGGCQYADICRSVANPALLDEPPLGFKFEHWSPFDEIKLEKLGFSVDRAGERPMTPVTNEEVDAKGAE